MTGHRDLEQHELLTAYLDGELGPEEIRQVERLLAESSGARSTLEALRALSHALAEDAVPGPPPGLSGRISRALDGEAVPFPARKRPFFRRLRVPLAAAATFIAALTLGFLYHDQLGLGGHTVVPQMKTEETAAVRTPEPPGEIEALVAPAPAARTATIEKKQSSAPKGKAVDAGAGADAFAELLEEAEDDREITLGAASPNTVFADESARLQDVASDAPPPAYTPPLEAITNAAVQDAPSLTWSPLPAATSSALASKDARERIERSKLLSASKARRRKAESLTPVERLFLEVIDTHGARAMQLDKEQHIWQVTVPEEMRTALLDALRSSGTLIGQEKVASRFAIQVLSESP